ncbi:uncharacterized protein LOC126184433 [Schistocerca cancellata]|uniref:uncharacterized protein LOC126184433 n=1 Tax=Schistocerca cancellata TaxID=274614 RepID=UPI002118D59D|nr:uncharacterized protein LOC126184433 [Schistocerca cancellata]
MTPASAAAQLVVLVAASMQFQCAQLLTLDQAAAAVGGRVGITVLSSSHSDAVTLSKAMMRDRRLWVTAAAHTSICCVARIIVAPHYNSTWNGFHEVIRRERWEPQLPVASISSSTQMTWRTGEVNKNLTGVHLRAIVVVTSTQTDNLHERLVSEKEKHLDPLARFNYALFLHLREVYNFTFSVQATRSWGYKTKAGRFDGMMGVIQRNEADIGASSALIKKERLEIVDYAGHTWKFWSVFCLANICSEKAS